MTLRVASNLPLGELQALLEVLVSGSRELPADAGAVLQGAVAVFVSHWWKRKRATLDLSGSAKAHKC